MTRLKIWLATFVIGAAIYLSVKTSLGFGDVKTSLSEFFDCAYWSGVALFLHWASNRNEVNT